MTRPDLPAPLALSESQKQRWRGALLQELERVSADVRAPSRRHGRTRLLQAAGLTATAGAVWAAVPALLGTEAAFASWTAVPAPLSSAAVLHLTATCESRLQSGGLGSAPSPAPAAVVAERRGKFSAAYVKDAAGSAVCLDGPRTWFAARGAGSRLASGAHLVLTDDGGKVDGSGALRYVQGTVDSSVAGVVVSTAGGRKVTATVEGGHFFAWWPSGDDPLTVQANNSDGSVVDLLTVPSVPEP